jgi:phage tail-like protein
MAVIGAGALAAALSRLGLRQTPYTAFNFHVEVEGLLLGSFTDVSGLAASTDVVSIREGGLNSFEHRFPGRTSHADITFQRGVVDFDMVWTWYQEVVEGRLRRRNGTIYLLDPALPRVLWWDFYEAWPVSWKGPDLGADSTRVAAESLTLTHQGLTRRG